LLTITSFLIVCRAGDMCILCEDSVISGGGVLKEGPPVVPSYCRFLRRAFLWDIIVVRKSDTEYSFLNCC
jgi:hypothetical protein